MTCNFCDPPEGARTAVLGGRFGCDRGSMSLSFTDGAWRLVVDMEVSAPYNLDGVEMFDSQAVSSELSFCPFCGKELNGGRL